MKGMKPLTYILFLFISINSFAQKITIDYWVDYEIYLKGKRDTITIGYNKNGDYLYTNSETIAKKFQESFFNNSSSTIKNSELHIVFNLREKIVYFLSTVNKNEFFIKIDTNDFSPPIKEESPFQGIKEFYVEKTKDFITIDKKKYHIHDISADIEPDIKLGIAYSDTMKFDNSVIFNTLFLDLPGYKEPVNKVEFPKIDGVILYISSENTPLIKAIKTNTEAKTLDINYSYKITE